MRIQSIAWSIVLAGLTIVTACIGSGRGMQSDTAFADTTRWSRVTAVSVPVSFLVPPTFQRAIRPRDNYGTNIDTGNLYTEVTTEPGPVTVFVIPLPRWLSVKKDHGSWMTTVQGVAVQRESYVERLTRPDYYVETAKFRLNNTS